MPLVRIELPPGASVQEKVELRLAVKAAVLKTLAPKESKYDYVAVREMFAELGDGVPLVTIDLRPGERVRRSALARTISEAMEEILGVRAEDVYVLFRGTAAAEHYCGGRQLADCLLSDG